MAERKTREIFFLKRPNVFELLTYLGSSFHNLGPVLTWTSVHTADLVSSFSAERKKKKKNTKQNKTKQNRTEPEHTQHTAILGTYNVLLSDKN